MASGIGHARAVALIVTRGSAGAPGPGRPAGRRRRGVHAADPVPVPPAHVPRHATGPRHRPPRRRPQPTVVPLVVALVLSVLWQVGQGEPSRPVVVASAAFGAGGLTSGPLTSGPLAPGPLTPQASASSGSAGDALGGRRFVAPDAPPAVGVRPRPAVRSAEDRLAGLRSHEVRRAGSGRLVAVPGDVRAPGRGPVRRVRVEVEAGLPVDGRAFAEFVMATLNDRRSWGRGGRMTFARTDGAADIRVVLASPDTSARMCGRLQTRGVLSCGTNGHAVLTFYRWVRGTPDYGRDLTGYRRYLVNHEVGHLLGHGHEACPGRGRLAPVMQQQTKGLRGCAKNSWPYP